MTKIRWTNETWNPVTGCSHVSPGCEHCYAEALSLRFGWSKKPWKAQFAHENVILHPERLDAPRKWKAPRRVFVNSMSDLFHELVPFEFIDRVFDVMEACPRHTFQILTKRPERMRDFMRRRILVSTFMRVGPARLPASAIKRMYVDVNRHIWLGTSVEDQRRADERVPILLQTPAAVRFLSCEPLLGPVDLEPFLYSYSDDGQGERDMFDRGQLHWVIAGGESGPRFRPMDQAWARKIRDDCVRAGVAFFYKQGSGIRTEMDTSLHEEDGTLTTWEQYPDEMGLAPSATG